MDRSEIRKIGGSDIAALLGLNKWKSAHSLYLHLVGNMPPQEDKEVFERGRKLEPVIASMFAANHEEFEVNEHGIIEHESYPFLIGSPDRVLTQNGDLVSGLEIKTATEFSEWGEEGSEEIPVEYLCQCQWYAGLMHVPDWHLAVGFVKHGSRKIQGYKEYIVKSDIDRFNAMLAKAVEFWTEHVEKQVPPPITEADAETVRYYRTKYPQHEADKWLDYDSEPDEIHGLLCDLINEKSRLDSAERQFELYKTLLIQRLENCEGIKTPFGNITYRTSKPVKRIDWEGIVKHINVSSETIDKFTTETAGSRRFLIPKQKGVHNVF